MDGNESVSVWWVRWELRPTVEHGVLWVARWRSDIAPVDDEKGLDGVELLGEVIVHIRHPGGLVRHDQYLRVDKSTGEGPMGKVHAKRQHPNPGGRLWIEISSQTKHLPCHQKKQEMRVATRG